MREGRSAGHFEGMPALSPVAAAASLPNAQAHRHHSRDTKAMGELPSVLEGCPDRQSAVEVSVWCRCSGRVPVTTLRTPPFRFGPALYAIACTETTRPADFGTSRFACRISDKHRHCSSSRGKESEWQARVSFPAFRNTNEKSGTWMPRSSGENSVSSAATDST